jgi:hypothetical protein
MSTQCVAEMSHLSAIGYLSIGETPLATWRPDVALNQIEVKLWLENVCTSPFPALREKRKMVWWNHNCFKSFSLFFF